MNLDRISIDPTVMNGQPCVRGTRLTVKRVLHILAENRTLVATAAFPSAFFRFNPACGGTHRRAGRRVGSRRDACTPCVVIENDGGEGAVEPGFGAREGIPVSLGHKLAATPSLRPPTPDSRTGEILTESSRFLI